MGKNVSAIKGYKYDKQGNVTHFGFSRAGDDTINYVPLEEPSSTADYLAEKVQYGMDYATIDAIRKQLLGKKEK